MNSKLDQRIEAAIAAVDAAIAAHVASETAPLSLPVLRQVIDELKKMREYSAAQGFLPTYPRFIMDWPDDSGLVDLLVDVAYEYKKTK